MKKIAVLFVLFALALGCSVQKRKYTSGYFVEKSWKKHPSAAAGSITKNTANKKEVKANCPIPSAESQPVSYQAFTETAALASAAPFQQYSEISKQVVTIPMDTCDLLILKSGEEIAAKILEITDDAIKYKKCENLLGPTYTMAKERVFMVKYINGTKEVVEAPEKTISTSPQKNSSAKATGSRKVQGMALWGFIIALVGWFVPAAGLALVMELAAIVLGIGGLIKIDKYPDKFKGKGFAITALILGVLGIIVIAALMV